MTCGNGKNNIHFPGRIVHIRVWMHEHYVRELYGVVTPRLGGWAW